VLWSVDLTPAAADVLAPDCDVDASSAAANCDLLWPCERVVDLATTQTHTTAAKHTNGQ